MTHTYIFNYNVGVNVWNSVIYGSGGQIFSLNTTLSTGHFSAHTLNYDL
jgi:hypothetical protein